MKKLLATAAVIASITTTANAATKYATITSVSPNYETVYMNVPQQRCQNVEVPVYGTVQGQGANGGDVLAGMIIGGLLGKGATGQDNGAAAGAVIGGIIAAENGSVQRRVITGYRTERQCSEVMVREQQREIKNYTITYRWNGVTARSYTYNRYNVGDRIPVTVTINAN
jgi:uncharacterized protein YcfJ